MKSKTGLQIARLIVSFVVTGLISISFLDITATLPVWVASYGTHWQFVPSILSFLVAPALAACGFIIIVLLTLLFGRVYCSWLCPLGFFQDVIGIVRRLFGRKRKKFQYRRPVPVLRFALLALIVGMGLTGIMVPVVLTDPFSIFGRMMTHLVHPVVAGVNNLLSSWLGHADVFWLKPRTTTGFHSGAFLTGSALTLIIGVMAFRSGRLWCNTICPAGTLLGILSRKALWRITLDKAKCISCGVCSSVCKAQCIDVKERRVDFDRCVGCMDCLNTCRQGGIRYEWLPKQPITEMEEKHEVGEGRRTTLKAFILLSATVILTKVKGATDVFSLKKAVKSNNRKYFVSPPGSVGIDRFNDICTACHLCVSACPTRVLQPSITEYGLKGFLQPYMDYHSNFCNFECTRCGEVCPTGAITRLLPEVKKRVQTGIAHFVKENCVVYTDETSCGACSEHCPTKAVHMVEYKPGLLIPEVNDSICVGCGACEYACPTLPNRAIFVNGNLVHLVASEPESAEENKEEVPEEFPF